MASRRVKSSSLQWKQRSGLLATYSGLSNSPVATYSCVMPKAATKASASRLCDSGSEAESAVTATALVPRARWGAHAREAEPGPREKATMTRPMAERSARSWRCFSSREPRVVRFVKAAISLGQARRTVLPSLLKWQHIRLVGGRLLGFGQDAGGGHLVAFLQIHQADALRGAPGLANGGRLDPDDLAVLADDHDVGILLHQENAHHAPGLVGGLHVDDTLAAAGNQAVGRQRGALAVAVLGDGKEQSFLLGHFHANQVIVRVETHGAHAARLPAHRADVFLAEADGMAAVGGEEHVVVAVSNLGADEFVAFVQRDGDDAARHGVIELGEFALLDDAVLGDHDDVLVGDEILNAEEGLGLFVGLQVDEVGEVLALARGGGIGNFVGLEPVDAAARSEDQ